MESVLEYYLLMFFIFVGEENNRLKKHNQLRDTLSQNYTILILNIFIYQVSGDCVTITHSATVSG